MNQILKSLKLDFRIKVGYGMAFLLLLVSYIFTWFTNKNLMDQSKGVVHTNKVITHLTELISYMKDAETGVRGYFIRKDKAFLEPYEQSIPLVRNTFDSLKAETKTSPGQQVLLYKVKGWIDRKYFILDSSMKNFDTHYQVLTDTVSGGMPVGKMVMDSLRLYVDKMKTSEQQELKERNDKLYNQYVSMNIILITSLVLAFLFALLGFLTYFRENHARRDADRKLHDYQDQLQKRIAELDIANKELMLMRRTEKFAATGRIARTIAHEVRNPLTNIDLAIGQIKTEMRDIDENAGVLFEMVNRNSKRINQLITELLNATRFVELTRGPVSINILLDESLEMARDRIELSHILIEKNYSTDICDISVDADKIKIVFLNIIVNAVEAMEPGKGVLKVKTYGEGDFCVTEICDNGIGMDAASLGNLFEPYYTTKAKGNGLGLTNAQNIILNHNGVINVESKPGKGTCFTIKFNFATKEQS